MLIFSSLSRFCSGPIVVSTIRNYFNLNHSAHINLYQGPILLIRRTKDEIISTNEAQPLQTNRGNDLLIKLLQNRFPRLINEPAMDVLIDWLHSDPGHQGDYRFALTN